jgi:gliding motility-associated-like protein
MNKFILLLCCVLAHSVVFSQSLTVTGANTPPYDPVSILENYFFGPGVEVLNVTYQGDPESVGFFDDGTANIGIDRGIIMTTGRATNAQGTGATFSNNLTNASWQTATGVDSDADLGAISNNPASTVNDGAFYIIDFIPTFDTLTFTYIFGSEEYLEYVGSDFNDVFGFFISGPGITGPYSNSSKNIALIPNTNTPVAINNVNNGTNSTWYVNNPVGTNNTIQYDGRTKALTATAIVQPCQPYKIKLKISDISDASLDSGVFLAAGSFKTKGLSFNLDIVSKDSTIVEGCANATLNLTLGQAQNTPVVVNYQIRGTATNGLDYVNIPASITIPPGQTAASIVFDPIDDNIAEGTETIIFDVQTNVCFRDTITLYVKDNELVTPDVPDQNICQGSSVVLDGTLNMQLPPSTVFTNNTVSPIQDNNITSPVQSVINVAGISPTIIEAGTIFSVCFNIQHTYIGDVDVYLKSPSGQFIILTSDNGGSGDNYTQTCFTANASNIIEGLPNTAAPFTGSWVPEQPWDDLFGATTNGPWTLLVSDDSQGFTGTFLGWSITFPPRYSVSYAWTPPANLSCTDCAITQATPPQSATYTITASDTYGCFTQDTARVNITSVLPAPVVTCSSAANCITFSWQALSGVTAYEVNVNGTGWISPNGVNSHQVCGVSGQTDIEVRGVAAGCGANIGTQSCSLSICGLTVTAQTSSATCNGGVGTATAIPSNGTGTYDYLWSNGSTTNVINTVAGTYTVTVTDDNACTTTASATITQPTALQLSVQTTEIACNGGQSTLTANVQGGTAPYTYLWSNGSTANVVNAIAGTYTATVTDNNACTTTASATITQPTALQLSVQTMEIACNGGQSTLTANVQGGTAPYTYLWSNGSTTNVITTLAGTYTVTVTDDNACTTTASATITQPTALQLSVQTTGIACNGGQSTLTANVQGGTAPYTYLWSNGSTTNVITTLAGTYTITVTDDNACTTTASVTITQPTALQLSVQTTEIACNGGQSTLTANVQGGTAPYTYLWSNGSTANVINTVAGTYTVTVTDDNACITTASISVNEPLVLDASLVSQNVLCNGDNSGSIQAIPSGGTTPYTYLWSHGATTSSATSLLAGNYTLTLTDSNNCTTTFSSVITEPQVITVQTSSTPAACNGGTNGTATVVVQGGITPYTYLWENNQTTATANNLSFGDYNITITDANGCTIISNVPVGEQSNITFSTSSTPTTCYNGNDGTATITITSGTPPYSYTWSTGATDATATNLLFGDHNFTISDATGCSAVGTITITTPAELQLTLSATPATCNGAQTGIATANVTGGTGNYTYLWSNGSTLSSIGNINAGNYTVTITDANSCTVSAAVQVGEPAPLTVALTPQNIQCNGASNGSILTDVIGGTPIYTYLWSNAQTNSVASNLTAGMYNLTVTDANNCTATATTLLTEPAPIELQTTSTPADCNGGTNGTATVSIQGGVAPFTYTWSNGQTTATATSLAFGSYTVTVTDASSCSNTVIAAVAEQANIIFSISTTPVSCFGSTDGSATITISSGTPPYTYLWDNGETTIAATQLTGGSHAVTITDGTGCSSIRTLTIAEPNPITILLNGTEPLCYNTSTGSITATVTGGNTSGYTYLWSNAQTNQTATSLAAGDYTLTVADLNGCTQTAQYTLNQPSILTLTISAADATCFGATNGSATTDVQGGTPPYTYAWSHGAVTPTASALAAGTYTVTITDLNNCAATATTTINQPTELIIANTTSTNVSCYGVSDGTASIQAVGGIPPYTYQWSTTPTQNTPQATNLPAGNYAVTVTDANGCDNTTQIAIQQPSELTLTLSQTPSSCYQGTDGTAIADVQGGTLPYTYQWSNGANTATNTNLVGGGSYTITVTDVNGCAQADSITIQQPQAITLTTSSTSTLCYGSSDGTATVIPIGGTAPYTYQWSNTQTDSIAVNLAAANYTITVTDANGCSNTATTTVQQPTPIVLQLQHQDIPCAGDTSGVITTTIAGGTAPYIYLWSNNATTTTLTQLDVGNYTLTVTDANGCTQTATTQIASPYAPLQLTIQTTPTTCFGDTDGRIFVQAQGGKPPYAYSTNQTNWNTSNYIVGLAAGNHTVYVRDANNCTTDTLVTISEPPILVADAGADQTIEFGDSAQLIATTNQYGNFTYIWTSRGPDNISCDQCPTTYVKPSDLQQYYLQVTDTSGCTATDDVRIYVEDIRRVFVASAFSPNGDNINDFLFVQGGSRTLRVKNFQVYNRWGTLVFQATDTPLNDTSYGWNGTFKSQPLNMDVFAWQADIEFTDGEIIHYQGNTTLIR